MNRKDPELRKRFQTAYNVFIDPSDLLQCQFSPMRIFEILQWEIPSARLEVFSKFKLAIEQSYPIPEGVSDDDIYEEAVSISKSVDALARLSDSYSSMFDATGIEDEMRELFTQFFSCRGDWNLFDQVVSGINLDRVNSEADMVKRFQAILDESNPESLTYQQLSRSFSLFEMAYVANSKNFSDQFYLMCNTFYGLFRKSFVDAGYSGYESFLVQIFDQTIRFFFSFLKESSNNAYHIDDNSQLRIGPDLWSPEELHMDAQMYLVITSEDKVVVNKALPMSLEKEKLADVFIEIADSIVESGVFDKHREHEDRPINSSSDTHLQTSNETIFSLDDETCFLIHLDQAAFILPDRVAIEGTTYYLKKEMHITVIGRNKWKKELRALVEFFPFLKEKINMLINDINWAATLEPGFFKIQKKYEKEQYRSSIIKRVYMPGMNKFYRRLKDELGVDLGAVPVPHVTLYVDEPEGLGIFIGSEDEFSEMNPKRIDI